MRTLAVVSIVLALASAGCIQSATSLVQQNLAAGPGGPSLDGDGFLPRVVDGFVFDVLDVVIDPTFTVHAEVYLPDVAKPAANATAAVPDTFPTILVMSPYFGAGQGGVAPGHAVYNWLVTELLPRGYAVVLADVAGTGGSGGCWDFMGPDEVKSTVAMVEGIAAQDWSNGKVGMIGKSYDAMTQIMAASQAPEHLVTIVPVAPLTHTYAGLFMNGVHYGGGWMATTTSYDVLISAMPPDQNQERYPGYVQHMGKKPACAGQNALLGNDPTGSYNSYHQARDFRPSASDVTASVLFMQGFLDPAVKPDNAFPWFTNLTSPKKMWLGQWEHDYPNATFGGRDDMYLTLHRWFDHWLGGAQNGIDQELGVDVQDSLGRWRHEDTWPQTRNASATTLWLAPDALAMEAPADGAVVVGGVAAQRDLLLNDDSGITLLAGEPLAETLHVSGMPRLTLVASSDRPGGQVVAKLWDVDDAGARRLVTQGAYNLVLANGLADPAPLRPGTPVTVAFDLYPTDYVVAAGHHLELVLEGSDASTWFNPDPWSATITLATGASGSMLSLPTVTLSEADILSTSCGVRVPEEVGCHVAGLVDQDREGA